MNTRQLEYVLAVAEYKNITEASKALLISQPSLSQYIKNVENEIGTPIFERTNPLKLTYQGEIYVRYAKKVLEEEAHMRVQINDIVDERVGRIKIGAGPLNSHCVLPKIIKKFYEEYPKVEVDIAEEVESNLLDQLNEGRVDMILTLIQPTTPGNYEIEEITRENYILAIPDTMDLNTNYEWKIPNTYEKYPEIDISTCKDVQFVMQEKSLPAHQILDDLCRKKGFLPQKKIICNNIVTALAMAMEGIGACFIPSSTVAFFRAKNLHYYRIMGNQSQRVLKVIYRRETYLTKAHKHFIQILHECYEER